MDNDKLRRGEETVHVKYGVKKAYMLANKYILEAIGNILEICGRNKDDNGECNNTTCGEGFSFNPKQPIYKIPDNFVYKVEQIQKGNKHYFFQTQNKTTRYI